MAAMGPQNFPKVFSTEHSFHKISRQRRKKTEKNNGGGTEKKKKKILSEIVATNVVVS